MEISHPNEHGVLPKALHVVVARKNRAYAAVNIAFCEDGLYRHSVEMQHSHGGFSGPIHVDDEGFASIAAARTAGLEELLRRWREPFPSDSRGVHVELAELRRQIEAQLMQPSLF